MRTVGVFLIHAGVTLRCFIRLPRMQHPGWVIALLALNAVLLILEAWLSRRRAARAAETPALDVDLRPVYLLLQAAIITGLLFSRPTQDFFALLFIPISLSAVLFYGKRGFLWIAAFTVALAVPLITSKSGWRFGAVMMLNYGGLCFLFGGYAYQVRKAEAVRSETQRVLGELQVAHHQLREYASQKEELAAEQERTRLARELHDSVTQTVFSMNLTVQAARLLLERDRSRVAGQLQRLEELAAGALREIQALVSSLRPAPVVAEDLPAALRRLAAERRSRDGLQVTLEVVGDRKLAEPVVAGLYLIAQEALTNVTKHAGTSEATVRLRMLREAASLEVEDRGRGFQPEAGSSERGHLGLAGMAERARDLGWDLTIESQPGRGTRIRVAALAAEATNEPA
jgi:signal transduction histidine kinase